MAQFYTLEEAARVLGMSAEELKSKAQSREVRAFLDGGSWRFRVVDVDELARRRGLGSDAELRLSDLEVPRGQSGSGEVQDLDLSEFHLGVAKPDLGAESVHLSKAKVQGGKSKDDSGSDHDILLDDLALPPNPMTGSSSVIIGAPSSGKHPSDSDVRLVPDIAKGASDSDVQLAVAGTRKQPSDSDVTLIKEDTGRSRHHRHGELGAIPRCASARSLGSSAEVPASVSDSDFELNPSSELIDALQPDSGSDFELSALDASDEFESTPLAKPSDSDVTASDPKLSGINLSRPSDSGINLQTGAGLGLGQADSIELAPLSDEQIPTSKTHKTTPAAKPSKPKASLAATPPPVGQEGRERHLRRHRLRSRCPQRRRRFRRQDRPARSRQRLRPGRQRHRLRGLRHRRRGRRPERLDRHGPLGVRRGRRGRGRRRLRLGRLERDDRRLVELGVVGQSGALVARPWCSPATPIPSGAASGSACWASPRSSSFSRRSSRTTWFEISMSSRQAGPWARAWSVRSPACSEADRAVHGSRGRTARAPSSVPRPHIRPGPRASCTRSQSSEPDDPVGDDRSRKESERMVRAVPGHPRMGHEDNLSRALRASDTLPGTISCAGHRGRARRRVRDCSSLSDGRVPALDADATLRKRAD